MPTARTLFQNFDDTMSVGQYFTFVLLLSQNNKIDEMKKTDPSTIVVQNVFNNA